MAPSASSISALSTSLPVLALNPFEIETKGDQARIAELKSMATLYGCIFIVLVFAIGVAGQKYDSVGRVINCSRQASINWVKLDLLFGLAHTVPDGGVVMNRSTSFGGVMSVVCLLAVGMLAAQLGLDTLAPVYATDITTEPPVFVPRGTFRLTVLVHGSCTDSLVDTATPVCAVRLVELNSREWTGAITSKCTSVSSVDGTCKVVWECTACSFNALARSTIRLIAPLRAWATHVDYTIEMPKLISSANDPGTDSVLPPFTLKGVLAVPGADTGSVMQAPIADLDSQSSLYVLLTLFSIVEPSLATRVTYMPVVTSTEPGAIKDRSNFGYNSTDGFVVNFGFSDNTFTIVKYALGG
jgi:hypothetical protein